MARAIGDFSSANTPETDLFTLDFVNDLVAGDSVVSATWTISVLVGTDNAADSYKIGDPTVFGSKVTQKAAGFLPGVEYCMTAQATTQFGLTPILWAPIQGEAIGC